MNFKKYHVSKNVMPAGELKTVESNGVTFSSDGKGKYSISGTATEFAIVRFDLLSGFTTPISVSNGGQGTLSFFNTQSNNKVTVRFYNGTTIVDSWTLTSIRRTNTAYNALGNKYVDNVVITVSSGTTVDMTITPEFTNDGVLPSEFEPYSSEVWHDIPHYLHNTSTDTLTTLPADVYADGNNATVGLMGNMSQTGTPTPTTPIQPSECGERSSNLVESYIRGCNINASGGLVANAEFNMFLAKVEQGKTYCADVSLLGGYFYNKPTVGSTSYDGQRLAFVSSPFTAPIDGYLAYRKAPTETTAMMNEGNELLPYSPYGYKIPILSANTTTPVYLGEVESTRRIKKLVFDGTENWILDTQDANRVVCHITLRGVSGNYGYCTHIYWKSQYQTTEYDRVVWIASAGGLLYISLSNGYLAGQTVADFKAYLQQQYANGTPVTVWYVLATPETAVVNEPLRKIGDYADEVSGITIPTIAGANALSIGTTLQPSEVSVNYKGWHPVADVHEADNGAWT